MSEETPDIETQAQPQPQPAVGEKARLPQLNSVPAIQNVHHYFAVGPEGQLYAFDRNLNQWVVANSGHMKQLMAASGIPPQTMDVIFNTLRRAF